MWSLSKGVATNTGAWRGRGGGGGGATKREGGWGKQSFTPKKKKKKKKKGGGGGGGYTPSCPLANHRPQFGCPGLIPGGINNIEPLHLPTRKIQITVAHWATKPKGKVPTLVAQYYCHWALGNKSIS